MQINANEQVAHTALLCMDHNEELANIVRFCTIFIYFVAEHSTSGEHVHLTHLHYCISLENS